MTFTELANLVAERGLPYNPTADLPRPNVYWGTVRTNDNREFHDYVAAEHTRPALAQLVTMATVALRRKLVKSNCMIFLRRLTLGDLLDNPGAFEQALTNAQALGDHVTARVLERLPIELGEQLGVIHEHEGCDVLPLLAASHIAPQRVLRH